MINQIPDTHTVEESNVNQYIAGAETDRPIDAIFVNSPLKNYDVSPRHNDFTLPVLGLGYIATYAKTQGFNVGVLDAEGLGLGISHVASIINQSTPRWVGLNLLAPTYAHSVDILKRLDPDIQIMLGGHQAKAMPQDIILDPTIPHIEAMVLGEGELRAAALLEDISQRDVMPEIYWKGSNNSIQRSKLFFESMSNSWLAPDVNALPYIDRVFLPQDPFRTSRGTLKANMVGSRGCPYDCSFCGAAISANPDITIRTRDPQNILGEMNYLHDTFGVTEFRFVDDLFLASLPFMKQCLPQFVRAGVKERFSWDATGRINVLSRMSDDMLDLIVESGCKEIALGIESGSERLLNYMGKRINPGMIKQAVQKLVSRGINIKGYFILGFPTETQEELMETVHLIDDLWNISVSTTVILDVVHLNSDRILVHLNGID